MMTLQSEAGESIENIAGVHRTDNPALSELADVIITALYKEEEVDKEQMSSVATSTT